MLSDRALLEVLRLRLQATVDEMAYTILRTGHTVFIKETGDFGTALVTPEGEVAAAPLRIGMVRMIGMPMKGAIEYTRPWHEGDVFISNDPRTTRGLATHLPDLFIWKPVIVDGKTVAFVWSFIHASDVGGRVPGSISPANEEIFQEGLIIPPSHLYRQGELNQEIVNLIVANSRIPDHLWGDIKAALAALSHGERRLRELVEKYGVGMLEEGMGSLLSYAEQQARELLGGIPRGRYSFADYLEGVGTRWPTRIRLALEVGDGEVLMDFTGTDPQVPNAFNLPTYGVGNHYFLVSALVNYFRTLQPDLVYNSGLVRPVRSVLPEGSLLNPVGPVACGVRATTMHRVYDVVMGCLAQAIPGVVPAAGAAGGGGISLLAVPDELSGRSHVSVLQPSGAGSGGRPTLDGVNGRDICVGAVRNIPTEVIEQDLPILVHKYGLRENEVGAGKFRGGFGLELRFELRTARGGVTCRGQDRFLFRPWGLAGGQPGTTGKVVVSRVGAPPEAMGRIDLVTLERGDILHISAQGGSGYGNPWERDPQKVLSDVLNGYITAEKAAEEYGVVVVGGVVDERATEMLRGERGSELAPPGTFAFGPEREGFESRWTDEIQLRLLECLGSLSPSLRHFVRLRVMEEAEAAAAREPEMEFQDVLEQTLRRLGLSDRPYPIGNGHMEVEK